MSSVTKEWDAIDEQCMREGLALKADKELKEEEAPAPLPLKRNMRSKGTRGMSKARRERLAYFVFVEGHAERDFE